MSGDESAIRRLLVDYCHLIDDGRFDEWILLFNEDIVFTVMGNRLVGRAELRGFIEPSQQEGDRGRHLLSEPRIDLDGDTARVTTDYAFVSRSNTILSTGRYFDTVRRAKDRWCFSSREIVFTGDTPTGLNE